MCKYFGLPIDGDLSLVIPEMSMAEEIFELIDSDREHLRAFLDFVDGTATVENEISYLKMKMDGVAKGTDKLFLIADKDQLIGCVDLHFMDATNKKAEIGYWIHSSQAGKNRMTMAVKKVCAFSFDVLGLNKLTIQADVNNIPSNRVAQKAGFQLVGIKLQDSLMYGQYRDLNEYALLKSDFESLKVS